MGQQASSPSATASDSAGAPPSSPPVTFEEVTSLRVVDTKDPGNLSGAGLAWENMRRAAQAKNCSVFGLAAVAWLKATPGADFRVLEDSLHASDVEANVLAIDVPDGMNKNDFRHPTNTEAGAPDGSCCMAIYACGSEEFRKSEYAAYGMTAEQNYPRLAHACAQKQFFEEAILERQEGTAGKILRNTHLLKVTSKPSAAYYDDVVRERANELNQQPERVLVATTSTGGSITQVRFHIEGSSRPIFDLVESVEWETADNGPRQRRRILQMREIMTTG